MANIKLANNFNLYRDDFQKDTGLRPDAANMAAYIAYVNARNSDNILQLISIYKSELLDYFANRDRFAGRK